jgi:hypothetical protein
LVPTWQAQERLRVPVLAPKQLQLQQGLQGPLQGPLPVLTGQGLPLSSLTQRLACQLFSRHHLQLLQVLAVPRQVSSLQGMPSFAQQVVLMRPGRMLMLKHRHSC